MSVGQHDAEETCLKNRNTGGDAPKVATGEARLTRNERDFTNESEAHRTHSQGSPNAIRSLREKTPPPTANRDDGFPEGGLRAWLVVFGSFSAMFMIFGIINSTGALQDYLSSNQLRENSPEQIAWIFSLNLFMVFFCGIYAGGIFDTHGPRVLVVVGSLALVLSMMLLSLCTEYWHFLLDYSILGGLGGALLNTPAYAAIGHFFKRRRGLATGIATTAGSIGGIIIPLMLQSLLPKIGYGWSVRVLGFLLLALAIPTNLFITTRLPPSKEPFRVIPDLTAFKNPSFALCTLGIFLMEWGLFVALTYQSSYVTTHGQDVLFGFTINALLNVGSFFGRWAPGLLADRLGRFNVIIATIALCVITVLALWLPAGNSEAIIIIFAITFGFASGSNLGLIPVCLSQLCRIEDYGRYFSAAFTLASFGTLTSVPIGGQLLSTSSGSYMGLIIFAGVSYAGAFCCYTFSRGFAVGWNPRTVF